MKKEKMNEEFMREISKIKDPSVFLGLARLLSVRLIEDKKGEDGHFIHRDFVNIFEDLMAKYAAAPSKRRKEILSILKMSNRVKEEGEVNGNSTEDTSKEVSE